MPDDGTGRVDGVGDTRQYGGQQVSLVRGSDAVPQPRDGAHRVVALAVHEPVHRPLKPLAKGTQSNGDQRGGDEPRQPAAA